MMYCLKDGRKLETIWLSIIIQISFDDMLEMRYKEPSLLRSSLKMPGSGTRLKIEFILYAKSLVSKLFRMISFLKVELSNRSISKLEMQSHR